MFDLIPRAATGLMKQANQLISSYGDLEDLATLGSSDPSAIGLGRYYDHELGLVRGRMRYGGPRHVVVFGPNGTGKGMRLLVPNLLQNEGRSIFVIDPKGELAAITAPHRRTLGRVVIINPFGVLTDIPGYEDMASAGFNPLRTLDPDSPNFNAAAALLAEAMIKIEGKDPHWDGSARALLAALIMHVAIEAKQTGQQPTITRVRELLCLACEEPQIIKRSPWARHSRDRARDDGNRPMPAFATRRLSLPSGLTKSVRSLRPPSARLSASMTPKLPMTSPKTASISVT